jgi:hypothetical protein
MTTSSDNLLRMLSNGDTIADVAGRADNLDDLTDALRRFGATAGQVDSAKNAFKLREGAGRLDSGTGTGTGPASDSFNAGAARRPNDAPAADAPPSRKAADGEDEVPTPTGDGSSQAKQTKNALDNRPKTKEQVKKESKDAEDAEGEEPPPKTPQEASSLWIKLTAGAALLTALVTAAMLAYGISLYFKKKDTTFNITKIENDSSGLLSDTIVKISFSPACDMCKRDAVTLTSTNSDPSMNGTYTVVEVYSDSQIGVKVKEKLKTDGSSGTMKVSTSLVRTVSCTMGAAADDLISPLADAAADTVSDILQKILFGFLGFIIVGGIIFMIISMMSSS